MPGKDTVSGIGDSFRFSTDCGVLAKECSPGSRTDRSLQAGERRPGFGRIIGEGNRPRYGLRILLPGPARQRSIDP